MTEEERNRRKQRILDVLDEWSPEEWQRFRRAFGSPEEAVQAIAILTVFRVWGTRDKWQTFMDAHGNPDEALMSLEVLGRIVERDRLKRRAFRATIRAAAVVTTLVVAFEAVRRFIPVVQTWFSQ